MKNMLGKIKRFFKKHGVFVSIAFVVIIFLVLLVALLMGDREVPDGDGVVKPPVNGEDAPVPDEFLIVRQPLGYHKNYEINFSTNVFNKLAQQEKEYYGFSARDINHLSWVEKLIEKIGKSNLSYTKEEANPENISYFWRSDEDSIFYDQSRDFLVLRFDKAIYIPEISFNPRDKDILLDNLHSMAKTYFSSDFEYEISNLSISGNNYMVEYSRILDGIPVYINHPKEYILLTPDGRLKEASFLLAEFDKYTNTKFPLISSSDLSENISLKEYPKSVEFKNLDSKIEDEYYTHGYTAFSNPFTQEGTIEVNEVELVYYYVSKSQEMIVPIFLFEGSGLLNVDGSLENADFTVLASAIESKFVYIHPDSHFEILESAE